MVRASSEPIAIINVIVRQLLLPVGGVRPGSVSRAPPPLWRLLLLQWPPSGPDPATSCHQHDHGHVLLLLRWYSALEGNLLRTMLLQVMSSGFNVRAPPRRHLRFQVTRQIFILLFRSLSVTRFLTIRSLPPVLANGAARVPENSASIRLLSAGFIET